MQKLALDLGVRSYDITIGSDLLTGIGDACQDQSLLPGKQIAIITDETVAPLYLETVERSLRDAGFSVLPLVLPDGEIYKSWETLQKIFDRLIEHHFDRSSALLALGGGVIGDLTGFAAASFLRGVNYLQVPTTLLAQVDSSVGGKTGINHRLGKNLIGAFYQPKAVWIDVKTLRTLSRRQLLSGMAEVIKYGVIRDAELFALLENSMESLVSLQNLSLMMHVVRVCCAIKAKIVAEDERERGARALLNMGHTFGHAIETLAGYGVVLHGEAVAMGMVLAANLSRHRLLCDNGTRDRIRALIDKTGLPVHPPVFSAEQYLSAMARDKKVIAGALRFVLPCCVGEAVLQEIKLSQDVINVVL